MPRNHHTGHGNVWAPPARVIPVTISDNDDLEDTGRGYALLAEGAIEISFADDPEGVSTVFPAGTRQVGVDYPGEVRRIRAAGTTLTAGQIVVYA